MPAIKLQPAPKVASLIREDKSPFQLIIIGGGPAGLTAGIYAKRANIDALLIEKAVPGGLITTTEIIENYPGFPEGISGMALGQRLEAQARKYRLDIVFGNVIKVEQKKEIFRISTEEQSYSSKTIIIASGSKPKKLGVKGEDALVGKGVSYCATCDGPFYIDKNVAVVGGGNGALEEAIFLTKFAKLVTIIHRRDALRADKVLEEKARANPKIFFKLNASVEEIAGKDKVTSVKLKDIESNKTSSINIDGVFIYTGYEPNSDIVRDLVKQDEHGHIITDEHLKTNIEGIFAAGDIRKKMLRQAVTAAADGAIAAQSVREFLEKHS
jgi:thioredoxin reductase (NADPH)